MTRPAVERTAEALEASDRSAVAGKVAELINWFARIPGLILQASGGGLKVSSARFGDRVFAHFSG